MANRVAKLIFIPAPGVGHVMPTIEIAKLLVNHDQRLSITILVIKPSNSTPGSFINACIESLAKNTIDRISFIELLQDEPSSTPHPNPIVSMFDEFIPSHCKHVRNVVADMKKQPGSGQIVGFVIDMFCACMIDVINEFNVPTYMFFTSGAAFLGFKFHIQTLCDDMNKDVIELSKSDTEISVLTFVKPLPTKLFCSLVQTPEGLDFVLRSVRKLRGIKGIMVNTFLELETHAIKSLSTETDVPPVYPVGPILNLKAGSSDGKKLDDEVISWLDSQPPSSVVFLCFGSMGSFDEAQVKEIAHGLEQSGHRFLWSLRQPPSGQSVLPGDYEDPSVVLPEGFMERTHGIGKVIGWAPQVVLLAHPAVGGFVSHCGWNSLLESLWFGVPLATWPMYAEQQMNAFEMVVELGLAVEITLDYSKDVYKTNANTNTVVNVTAKEIERGIRGVMEDNEVRTKVKEMSAKSRSTVVEDGSSFEYVGRLIQEFVENIS
ncbi:hypothetical protein QVD17_28010 [Tagetes erecta]|uniref:Glycosyltransferase n=1 Tax=Tagetes erecta TaxID=13708 RepID=A0AAD8NRW5_TARER|nr:hypothetical protein QVD17_28010 [Tagetes erecta]